MNELYKYLYIGIPACILGSVIMVLLLRWAAKLEKEKLDLKIGRVLVLLFFGLAWLVGWVVMAFSSISRGHLSLGYGLSFAGIFGAPIIAFLIAVPKKGKKRG